MNYVGKDRRLFHTVSSAAFFFGYISCEQVPEYRPAGYRYVQGVFRSRLGYLDGTVAHVGHLLCHPSTSLPKTRA